MKKNILTLVIFAMITSCSNSPLESDVKTVKNRANLSYLKKGMNQAQVNNLMGAPHQKGTYEVDKKEYEVWFYIIKPYELGQKKAFIDNLYPIVFKNQIVIGFGKKFFEYLFDIGEQREIQEEEERQKYTPDPEEWPSNENKIIPIIPESAEEQPKKSDQPEEKPEDLQEVLNKIQQDEEQEKAKEAEEGINQQDQQNLPQDEKQMIEGEGQEQQEGIQPNGTKQPFSPKEEEIIEGTIQKDKGKKAQPEESMDTQPETQDKSSDKKPSSCPIEKDDSDDNYPFWE